MSLPLEGGMWVAAVGMLLTLSVLHRLAPCSVVRRLPSPHEGPGPTRSTGPTSIQVGAPTGLFRVVGRPLTILRRRWSFERHRPLTADAVAEWCDSVARDVSAGATLRQALACVPADPAVESATTAVRFALERGRSVGDAVEILTGAHGRSPGPLRLVGSVLSAVADVGGSAAHPLRRVAGVLRLHSADGQERRAHSAQAKMSAHVLTALPIATLALLAATDPYVRSVITGPVGILLVGLGTTLNAVGWWWMRRIVGTTT